MTMFGVSSIIYLCFGSCGGYPIDLSYIVPYLGPFGLPFLYNVSFLGYVLGFRRLHPIGFMFGFGGSRRWVPSSLVSVSLVGGLVWWSPAGASPRQSWAHGRWSRRWTQSARKLIRRWSRKPDRRPFPCWGTAATAPGWVPSVHSCHRRPVAPLLLLLLLPLLLPLILLMLPTLQILRPVLFPPPPNYSPRSPPPRRSPARRQPA